MGRKKKAETEAKLTEGARAGKRTADGGGQTEQLSPESHADSQTHPPEFTEVAEQSIVFTELPGREGRGTLSSPYYSCDQQLTMIEFQLFARHCATNYIHHLVSSL